MAGVPPPGSAAPRDPAGLSMSHTVVAAHQPTGGEHNAGTDPMRRGTVGQVRPGEVQIEPVGG